ncbi:ABC transporter permease [Xanthobacter autotrophicus]|uniref:ABC transporter permease n=1 Tax=Xanthobacter autotrophicus TaxID=280 RepID=UPI001FE7FCFD|nr:ABC transporter permease [Xanthobacter autotrophicus]
MSALAITGEGSLTGGRPAPGGTDRRRRSSTAGWLLFPSLTLVLAGLILPLALMARTSVAHFDAASPDLVGFTLENYARFFGEPFYLTILARTLLVALSCTAICLVLGVPAAFVISRVESRTLKTALILATIIPLLMGNAVRAAGWMVLLADKGLINSALLSAGLITEPVRILYTGSAVVIGLIAVLLPFMIISLQSVFEGIGDAYEEAAQTMGAPPWTAFFRVTLPLAMPGIFSGCLLCFVLAMNAYATPVLIGGPSFQMMAPKVFEQAIKVYNWPFAATIALVLMAVTLALSVASSLALQKRYGAL